MPVLPAADLTLLATAIYEAAGTPPEHARIVVAHQVGANLAGHDSHGVMLLPTYAQRIDRDYYAGEVMLPLPLPARLRHTCRVRGTLTVV